MSPTLIYRRLAVEWWLVLVAASAVLSLLVAFQLTSRLDYLIYDTVQPRFSNEADPSVLIVAIDNRSIAEEGDWPWPRDRVASLVQEIGKAAPKSIGLDLLLLNNRDVAGDAALARAMETVPTYLPAQFEVPGQNGASFSLTLPLPALEKRARAVGHVNVIPDRDGLIRRAYLFYSAGQQSWPSLASLMAGTPRPQPAAALTTSLTSVPLIARDPVLIAFSGPAGTIPTVSASSVLKGEVPAELLRSRRILVGVTANGVGDVYATPAAVDGSLMPGVEIQANLLSTLLTHRAIVPLSPAVTLLLSLLPIVAIMVGLRTLSPRWTLPLIIGVGLTVMVVSVAMLTFMSIWMAPASAMVTIALLYPAWTWRKLSIASRYLSAELERSDGAETMFEWDKSDDVSADVFDRQMHLLSRAVERQRDLGKFLHDRLSQMPDCVIVTDVQGKVLFENSKAKWQFHEFNGPGELLYADDLLNYIYAVRPDGRSPIRFAAVSQLHGIPWNCRAEARSGQSFDVRFQPQRNSTQELVGYVIRVADNTEIMTTQRQRNDALELLSHDMRAPQSSIISFVNGLSSDDISAEAAERIRGYAGRTLKLADDFVHLARAQTVEVKIEPVDLVAVAIEAAQALWPQAAAKGIVIEDKSEVPELWFSGDGSLLSRMLSNLIDNAVKFGAANSTVMISCRERQIDGTSWASLTVINDGDGILPERMTELYRRFQSTSPVGTHGVGLGLAFVHTVAVRHHGRVTCKSNENGPTAFTVDLPLDVRSVNLPSRIAG